MGGSCFPGGGTGLIFAGTLPACPPCTPLPKPPPGGEWLGALGDRQEVLAAQREKGSLAAATQTAGGRGRAGSTSTRVAQGSSGWKLFRKETHISHVSLAGPTAGAVMVAASARHPPWSPAR